MKERGHEVLICAAEKDVALKLLAAYGFSYIQAGRSRRHYVAKIVELASTDYQVWRIAREFKPDIMTGVGSITASHVSALFGKPFIAFDDNEFSKDQYYLYSPFANAVCTPFCFKRDLGKKQVRYNGYKELAYLHHKYFKPDPTILRELGLKKDDTFVILRFIARQSTYDIGRRGFTVPAQLELVRRVERYARVFITSEAPLCEELKRYSMPVSPERLHDLLYYAAVVACDGGTTAAEAGVLGTPTVRYTNVTSNRCPGYLLSLEEEGLIYSFTDLNQAISKVEEILANKNLSQEWRERRAELMNNRIDVTAFMTWFIESYPESFRIMREEPGYQQRFKDVMGIGNEVYK